MKSKEKKKKDIPTSVPDMSVRLDFDVVAQHPLLDQLNQREQKVA
jgi:hypothetical protein